MTLFALRMVPENDPVVTRLSIIIIPIATNMTAKTNTYDRVSLVDEINVSAVILIFPEYTV